MMQGLNVNRLKNKINHIEKNYVEFIIFEFN